MKKTYSLTGEEIEKTLNSHQNGNKYFSIYWSTRNDNSVKISCIVGKKNGNAVFRNRARRLMKVACRENIELFEPGNNYVVLFKKPATSLSLEETKVQIKKILKQRIEKWKN